MEYRSQAKALFFGWSVFNFVETQFMYSSRVAKSRAHARGKPNFTSQRSLSASCTAPFQSDVDKVLKCRRVIITSWSSD